MRPLALTSATRRGARREQQEGATVADAGPSAPASDPHANTQLAQNLPRRPVREAPLRAPGTPHGAHLANVGRSIAYVGAAGAALCGGFAALQAPAAAAYGYLNDDLYYKNLAVVSSCQAVGALAAFLGMRLADVMAARYVEAQARWYEVPTKAQRASELGTTEACLDEAVDMVTIFDADHPGPAMGVDDIRHCIHRPDHLILLEDHGSALSDPFLQRRCVCNGGRVVQCQWDRPLRVRAQQGLEDEVASAMLLALPEIFGQPHRVG